MQLSEVRGRLGQEGGGTVFEACEWDSQRGLQEDGAKSISLRDKDHFKSEDLDQHTLLELEPPRSRSLGNHLVEAASESEIRKGQCGLARLWAPTVQGTGQGLTFPSVQWGKPIAYGFLGLPERALQRILHAFNLPDIP